MDRDAVRHMQDDGAQKSAGVSPSSARVGLDVTCIGGAERAGAAR
jgi:hypothetical protein